jgi:hypothetical protein
MAVFSKGAFFPLWLKRHRLCVNSDKKGRATSWVIFFSQMHLLTLAGRNEVLLTAHTVLMRSEQNGVGH